MHLAFWKRCNLVCFQLKNKLCFFISTSFKQRQYMSFTAGRLSSAQPLFSGYDCNDVQRCIPHRVSLNSSIPEYSDLQSCQQDCKQYYKCNCAKKCSLISSNLPTAVGEETPLPGTLFPNTPQGKLACEAQSTCENACWPWWGTVLVAFFMISIIILVLYFSIRYPWLYGPRRRRSPYLLIGPDPYYTGYY